MADVSDPSLPDARRSVNQLNKLRLIARFAARYRWRIVAALTALVVATMASLGVVYSLQPIIDKGFATDDPSSIDRYFLQLFAIIAVLSVATALRFHFVTTLGERVVADLRKAVHAHVVGLQPVFFEDNRPSEIASRLTADTTLIQTVVGSSASIALRNALMFVGGLIMLLLINPALVGLTALAIPLVIVPIAVLGGRVRALSRSSQDRVADVGAMANEALSAIQVVQAFTQERSEAARFSGAVERAFDTARRRVRVRSWMTAIVILLVFGAVDLVLWQGAKSVIAGTMTGGQMAAFVGYSVMVAAAAGAIVEVYGDLMRAAGCRSCWPPSRASRRRPTRSHCPTRRSAVCASRTWSFTTRRGPRWRPWTGSRWTSRRARRWRWSGRPARANRRCCSWFCASSIPNAGAS